ncbi:hypothetical protein [Actinomadura parmotrematis]|uniref:Uncharacterized protein n=1 Tax=Actinomadura parmotrematis TaxID=2864039 RepID=A0ABS7FM75_9ACTN|nr:hypothetical protein [Actinomadura parmotrematis]MBW8481451.1 hypothetical protein [Actinomadura parmotrematis]
MDERNAATAELMDGDAPVREKVATMLARLVEEESGGEHLGCLVVNTGIELAPATRRSRRSCTATTCGAWRPCGRRSSAAGGRASWTPSRGARCTCSEPGRERPRFTMPTF